MRAEVQYSILQNKFREWFEDPIPADTQSSEYTHRSIENPVPASSPLTTKAKHSNHRTRKRYAADPTRLIELLFFGFLGAVSFGLSVGITANFLNSNFDGWYSIYWPSQSTVIFIASVLGFNIGLVTEYVFLQRKRNFG